MTRRTSTACAAAPLMASDNAAARIRQFNEAKFGMFVRWRPSCFASVEASWPIMGRPGWKIGEADYRAPAERFNPVKYDPRARIRLAKAAGQRYLIFTSKRHDGFCMFDSNGTSYKATRTPYK